MSVDYQLHKLNHDCCPFKALHDYLIVRKNIFKFQNNSALFIDESGKALEREFFISKLKHLLSICGYNPQSFNGHSFRIGAATTAGKSNIEDHLIKTLDRWNSNIEVLKMQSIGYFCLCICAFVLVQAVQYKQKGYSGYGRRVGYGGGNRYGGGNGYNGGNEYDALTGYNGGSNGYNGGDYVDFAPSENQNGYNGNGGNGNGYEGNGYGERKSYGKSSYGKKRKGGY
ncbi:unnamed protein product [Mytilus coruscus]|uniref:Tyr recombinase domain-containing protein n=1 Tax=Mytilus coruscus TaxID=42192 RepID=A0A6J8D1R1_MYTCO|nr:unnamed protein product [Mytilus coruscus]